MRYDFPIISHIDDVRQILIDSGKLEQGLFKIKYEKDYVTIGYSLVSEDTFPSESKDPNYAIYRECRGLKFCASSGKILARPFHKFFNLNQNEEVSLDNVRSKFSFYQAKLDGSMIHPIILNSRVRYMTKGGITDISLLTEKFIEGSSLRYKEFDFYMIEEGYTPIYEFTSPQNKIILDYTEIKLRLLAVRDILTGKYLDRSNLRYFAGKYDIPLIDYIKIDENFDPSIFNREDLEGIVITLDDGNKVKFKSDWYVNLHKCKESILHERPIITLILDNQLDDLYPLLDTKISKQLSSYESHFVKSLHLSANSIKSFLDHYNQLERKVIATTKINELPYFEQSVTWKFYQNDYDLDKIVEEIKSRIKMKLYVSKFYQGEFRRILNGKYYSEFVDTKELSELIES